MATYLPIPQWFDAEGNPLAAGKVYSYITGTSTPQSTYTSSSGSVANANPYILDSEGRGEIWLSASQNYDLLIKDSNDNTIDSITNLSSDGITISLTGTLSTSLDMSSHSILFDDGSGIQDSNANPILTITAGTSPVNYFNITNDATGSGPVLSSTGSDTNIDINLTAKGSGTIKLNDNTSITGTLTTTGAITSGGAITSAGTVTLPAGGTLASADSIYTLSGTSTGPVDLRLSEDTDNGTNYISIKAPASIASNATLTLPSTTGTIYATGNTDVAVADGGTGSSTASGARTNLAVTGFEESGTVRLTTADISGASYSLNDDGVVQGLNVNNMDIFLNGLRVASDGANVYLTLFETTEITSGYEWVTTYANGSTTTTTSGSSATHIDLTAGQGVGNVATECFSSRITISTAKRAGEAMIMAQSVWQKADGTLVSATTAGYVQVTTQATGWKVAPSTSTFADGLAVTNLTLSTL